MNGSPKYSLNLADLKHIVVYTVMSFLASAPAVVLVNGTFDWKAAEALLLSSFLFVGQTTATRWLQDNGLQAPK